MQVLRGGALHGPGEHHEIFQWHPQRACFEQPFPMRGVWRSQGLVLTGRLKNNGKRKLLEQGGGPMASPAFLTMLSVMVLLAAGPPQ